MKDTTIIRYGERDVASLQSQFADIQAIQHPLQMADPCKLIASVNDTVRHLNRITSKYPEGTMGWLLTTIIPRALGPDMADIVIHLWRKTADRHDHVGAFDRLESFVSISGQIAVPIVLMNALQCDKNDDEFTASQKRTIDAVLWSIYRLENGPLSGLTCPPF